MSNFTPCMATNNHVILSMMLQQQVNSNHSKMDDQFRVNLISSLNSFMEDQKLQYSFFNEKSKSKVFGNGKKFTNYQSNFLNLRNESLLIKMSGARDRRNEGQGILGILLNKMKEN